MKVMGDGEALVETSGVLVFDASPMANLARSLSSRFDFGSLISGSGRLVLAVTVFGVDVLNDLRKLERADSANWVEDKGEIGRAP